MRTFPLLALVLVLAGCNATSGDGSPPVVALPSPQPITDATDDVAIGKQHFRAENYGLAEMHFRRAAEARRDDAQAWNGLAASYDKLRRWDLADRAYAQVEKITGPTPDFLNNRGYSYMLRGDLRRASADLSRAAAADPGNERIQNNLRTLDERVRRAR
jgi:Flp pilus assembly protein TadD